MQCSVGKFGCSPVVYCESHHPALFLDLSRVILVFFLLHVPDR